VQKYFAALTILFLLGMVWGQVLPMRRKGIKLTPGLGGAWAETTIHQFSSGTGVAAQGAVIFDNGKLYGTASRMSLAAPIGGGAVFKIDL